MATISQAERRARLRAPRSDQREIRVTLETVSGLRQVYLASLLDLSEGGIGIQLRTALARGVVVSIEANPPLRSSRARVCWCRPDFGSLFRAGLAFEPVRASAAELPIATGEDYYELLQVNPKANPDTIHRVYRMLAQRWHPDNRESGDEEAFKRLTRAYTVLSDPQQRAAYDIQREHGVRSRHRLAASPDGAGGKEAERRKRAGVLGALYASRVQDPGSSSLSIFDIEELLGVPREHLEFTLWYLKERAYVARSDNNRFQITISGVDYAESLESDPAAGASPSQSGRLLPSA